jgi:UDP-glucose 4-epimerase
MKVLVVGAAGYIGSHLVMMLLEHDQAVTGLDNLSRGHRDAVAHRARMVVSDLSQRGLKVSRSQ